jgi:hypothetical protein
MIAARKKEIQSSPRTLHGCRGSSTIHTPINNTSCTPLLSSMFAHIASVSQVWVFGFWNQIFRVNIISAQPEYMHLTITTSNSISTSNTTCPCILKSLSDSSCCHTFSILYFNLFPQPLPLRLLLLPCQTKLSNLIPTFQLNNPPSPSSSPSP